MEQKHLYTSDEKIKWWGYGEWVEEPDLVNFNHMGIECMVMRIALEEPHAKDFHIFGGYLNGYVAIPSDHPFYQKKHEDIDIDCHGGLTFCECSDRHSIGFDCAHSFDYIPSTEHIKKTATWAQKWRQEEDELKNKYNLNNSPIFNRSYKNIQFCIDECKSMAQQLMEFKKKACESDFISEWI